MQWERVAEGSDPSASAGSLDSQSVSTAVMVEQAVGYDAGKKTKGCQRFTLVDTFGLLLAVTVVAVSTQEREIKSIKSTTGCPAWFRIGRWGFLR